MYLLHRPHAKLQCHWRLPSPSPEPREEGGELRHSQIWQAQGQCQGDSVPWDKDQMPQGAPEVPGWGR